MTDQVKPGLPIDPAWAAVPKTKKKSSAADRYKGPFRPTSTGWAAQLMRDDSAAWIKAMEEGIENG